MASSDNLTGPLTELETSVVDVNVLVGPDVPASRSTGAADVGELRRRFGIGHALVRSSAAIRVARERGNRSVLDLAGEEGVSAVAVASALHLDRLPDELDTAVKAGARAVWVEYANWALETEAARRLLRVVEATGLPLLVPHLHPAAAARLGALTARTKTPVVLVEARYPDFTEVVPALERYENLHVETSSLGSYEAIECMARVVGHERILFGSGAPVRSPLSPMYAVLQARISTAAKRAIFGGNAARIFGLGSVPTATVSMTVPERLFDVHGHFFPAPWEVPEQSGEPLLGELAGFGIRTQVASSVPAIMGDLEAGNEQTVRACQAQPGQLGYLVAHPDDIGLAEEHIRKWGDAAGIVGIKVHAEIAGVPTSSPQMARLFDVLADYGRPVKIHNAGDGWEPALVAIARKHPRLPIIIAHAGFHRPQPSAATVVNGTPNVHIELASSKADIRDARDLVHAVDADRVLFGSDAPLINPAFVLGVYQDLGLPEPVLERVYWDNGERLFGGYR
ncbi:amidohydrolase family protein [Planosporangium thailandense]|uniref:Amidohydrolase family protein n=1 Tax=Planosporangium thailandense TaxID=765197 RepID=A0ABX0Y688_9ACTN|nr:amidohydrolase family protein [Planosporangium thailandense]NJC72953.1 amidohydrolase family protein [Planosporangium thailandense]